MKFCISSIKFIVSLQWYNLRPIVVIIERRLEFPPLNISREMEPKLQSGRKCNSRPGRIFGCRYSRSLSSWRRFGHIALCNSSKWSDLPLLLAPAVCQKLDWLQIFTLAFHVAQVMYGCVCFVMIMGLAYALSIFPFLAIELRPNKRNEYKLSNRIRTFAVLPSTYRSLEVLQLNVNCVVGMIFIPAQTIITQLVLICICMSVRRWGEIGTITKAILIGWASGALLLILVHSFRDSW